MFKSRLALFVLCLGTILALPAVAGADAAPTASVFSSPAVACQTKTAALFDLPGAAPEPIELTHCNAQQSCSDGCFISCTGHTSCTVNATSVTCDGVTTNCPFPTCTPPVGCLDPCGFCECRASGGTTIQCNRGFCLDCWPPLSCL